MSETKQTPSGAVGHSHPDANMYGCLPCPKCGSRYRASYKKPTGLSVECDDCGHKEPGYSEDGTYA